MRGLSAPLLGGVHFLSGQLSLSQAQSSITIPSLDHGDVPLEVAGEDGPGPESWAASPCLDPADGGREH